MRKNAPNCLTLFNVDEYARDRSKRIFVRETRTIMQPDSKANKTTNTVFEVTLAGVPLKLKSGQDPEMVKKLVSFVDNKVQEALPGTKSGSIQNAALLAALNMAEELFELKAQAVSELEKFEKKAQKVLSDLESSRPPRAGLDN